MTTCDDEEDVVRVGSPLYDYLVSAPQVGVSAADLYESETPPVVDRSSSRGGGFVHKLVQRFSTVVGCFDFDLSAVSLRAFESVLYDAGIIDDVRSERNGRAVAGAIFVHCCLLLCGVGAVAFSSTDLGRRWWAAAVGGAAAAVCGGRLLSGAIAWLSACSARRLLGAVDAFLRRLRAALAHLRDRRLLLSAATPANSHQPDAHVQLVSTSHSLACASLQTAFDVASGSLTADELAQLDDLREQVQLLSKADLADDHFRTAERTCWLAVSDCLKCCLIAVSRRPSIRTFARVVVASVTLRLKFERASASLEQNGHRQPVQSERRRAPLTFDGRAISLRHLHVYLDGAQSRSNAVDFEQSAEELASAFDEVEVLIGKASGCLADLRRLALPRIVADAVVANRLSTMDREDGCATAISASYCHIASEPIDQVFEVTASDDAPVERFDEGAENGDEGAGPTVSGRWAVARAHRAAAAAQASERRAARSVLDELREALSSRSEAMRARERLALARFRGVDVHALPDDDDGGAARLANAATTRAAATEVDRPAAALPSDLATALRFRGVVTVESTLEDTGTYDF